MKPIKENIHVEEEEEKDIKNIETANNSIYKLQMS